MDFWPLIAQIVPVLALALVLEARVIAGRFVEEVPWKSRVSQTAWGYLVFVVMVLLTTTFIQALIASNPSEPAPSWVEDPMARMIAVIVTALGLIIVFSIPLVNFSIGMTSKSGRRLDARLPWGRMGRLFVRIDYAIDRQKRVLRIHQANILDERMGYATELIEASRAGAVCAFDPDLTCLLHASDPCASQREHHEKELAYLDMLFRRTSNAISSLERDRGRLMRFAATGRSFGAPEVSDRRLKHFLGGSGKRAGRKRTSQPR